MRNRIQKPDTSQNLMLPIIGKIKVGEKRKGANGKEYPTSTDYFIATGQYSGLFSKAYGEKPDRIQLVFIDDENSCIERFEYRDTKGDLFAFGDGNTFMVWKAENERYIELKMDDINVIEAVQKKCASQTGWKVSLSLKFLIPKVHGIAGLWEFSTKGNLSTIPTITASYDSMLESRGFVKGIIFDLSVKFAKSQKPGVNSRYPVVSLIPNHSDENVKMIHDSVLKLENPLKALK